MLSYAFYMLLNAFPMLLYALFCFMSSLEQQMMLALCITGFCFAEAGKNSAIQKNTKKLLYVLSMQFAIQIEQNIP